METMVWNYGKKKWKSINKIGTLENIRKTGSMRNMKNINLKDIRKIGSMEVRKIGNEKISRKLEIWKICKM